jgi:hypothetical protein
MKIGEAVLILICGHAPRIKCGVVWLKGSDGA